MTPLASAGLHLAVALFCAAWAVIILAAGRWRPVAYGHAAAAAAAALWLGAVAAFPDRPLDGPAGAAEALRSLAWFALLLVLYRRAGGDRVAGPALRFGLAGGVLAALALAVAIPGVTHAMLLPSLGSPALLARLGLAIVTVLLAENLYRNADEAARWHVNLPCIAVATLSVLDLLLYADAVLSRSFSAAMLDARAVMTALAMPLFAVAAGRGRRLRRPLSLSREVAFHGATLVVAGTFLLGIGAAGEALRHLGADWSSVAQISLGAAFAMGLAVVAASASARSRLRRVVIDHFFAARYDYRREWLRCVDTLSSAETEAEAPVRAIRAIADPVDSPAGALLVRDPLERVGSGTGEAAMRYRWGGSWNMREAASLALAPDHALVRSLRGGDWVAVFAAAGQGQPGEGEAGQDGVEAEPLPEDIARTFGRLWLAVPLWHHREGLVGAVLLAPPRAPFPLDVETFDLLRTLGQEVAMFLAERSAAARLVDQRQLEDYARRFAFVAHDVKTVSSQLSLLLANAEENIADPEFQRDMLLTVRASAERINALIARLRQPEPQAPPQSRPRGAEGAAGASVEPLARLAGLTRGRRHPIRLDLPQGAIGEAAITPGAFDAAVTHLLDNAIEASAPGVPVTVALRREADTIVIDIIDRGPGMTAEFVRDRLFRPLSTSKPQGSGIGAWQARELLREAGGELSVLTSPGAGTTMRLALPIARDAGPAAAADVAGLPGRRRA